ncbi:MAG: substrate-binding domain-containing protein [Deltaproteobacteria bacterium]|nr:substrate-binding domain-containing protein [Deltaproteobacteria bacterium]
MKRYFKPLCFSLIAVFLGLSQTPAISQEGKLLRMATTTSTDNTGLLDYLKPFFKQETGIEVQWVSTGTGQALKLGENCDADVLLVHAPETEKKFVAAGFGINRREVMYNDFILIGPATDPAGIKGKSVKDALTAIQNKQSLFVSRGDKSGTHITEMELWKGSGLTVPDKDLWYTQAGQGMLATIQMAAERSAYTMTDRGTYIKYEDTQKGNPPLKILVEGDDLLKNLYSVIEVNPAKCTNVKSDLAKAFSEWMALSSTQKRITDFKLAGKQLFFIPTK